MTPPVHSSKRGTDNERTVKNGAQQSKSHQAVVPPQQLATVRGQPVALQDPTAGRWLTKEIVEELVRKGTPADFWRRFWAKVDEAPNGCWLWNGARNDLGYGHVRLGRGQLRAHRVAFVYFEEDLAPGEDLLHGPCNNPSCVRHDHLRRGTQAENNRDTKQRGRHRWANQHARQPDQVPA